MSKKPSKKASAPQGNQMVLSIDDLMAMMQVDRIDMAIEKVTGWPMKCSGMCFPLVYRAWMQRLDLQVA